MHFQLLPNKCGNLIY